MKIYRYTRVIFGAKPSQFLLNATVDRHMIQYEKFDPQFARKARKHLYSDDLCTGVETTDDGKEMYNKFFMRFSEASFDLSKWRTNDEELRTAFNETRKNTEGPSRVLGIVRCENLDSLILGVKEIFESVDTNKVITKRAVLRTIASVYDPVGILSPITI